MTDKVYIKLSVDELTFDEMIDIQEGNLRKAKAILVKFAADENGKRLGVDEANEAIGKLPLAQMREVFAEFGAQVTAEMNETLPNARGRR